MIDENTQTKFYQNLYENFINASNPIYVSIPKIDTNIVKSIAEKMAIDYKSLEGFYTGANKLQFSDNKDRFYSITLTEDDVKLRSCILFPTNTTIKKSVINDNSQIGSFFKNTSCSYNSDMLDCCIDRKFKYTNTKDIAEVFATHFKEMQSTIKQQVIYL